MALSANAAWQTRNDSNPAKQSAVILTGAKIYKGALVVLTAAGKAKPAANETTTTFLGMSLDEYDTGDGTVRCETVADIEILITAKTTMTAGLIGFTTIYAFDDAQVTNLATLGPACGTFVELESANLAWVGLRKPTFAKAS